MIIHLKADVDKQMASKIASDLHAMVLEKEGKYIIVTSSHLKEIQEKHQAYVDTYFSFEHDIQLSNRKYLQGTREIKIGNIVIGGCSNHTLLITGPCSVESKEQIEQSAQLLKSLGLSTLRAGTFKSRTSPYSFQGLGIDGLKLLDDIRNKYGLKIITEVFDSSQLDVVADHVDIIQISAKSMYNQASLNKCGKLDKPILLKRSFGATLQELLQASEFILSAGNDNVMLCERGIRTFETKTRFTLDLCGVSWLKHNSNLPVVLDPSHAMGYAYGIPDLSRACIAMGVDGLMIESHPEPSKAKSDAQQQLTHAGFTKLYGSLKAIAEVIGREIV
jgi:3-deoxy-7-phosphoheptulonate synthase